MRVIALPDCHFPYHHRRALALAIAIIKQTQPTHIIQMGDLYENKNFSRFPSKQGMRAEKELESGRYFAEKMWKDIKEVAPNAECIQILGNHCIMAIKRCQEKLPAAQSLVERSVMELFKFEGVTFHSDPRQAIWIEDVRFIHGYKKFGEHAKHSGHKTVCGHSHKGAVSYFQQEMPDGGKRSIWELNTGWLGDEDKFVDVFNYTPNKISPYTLGIGMIDSYGPRFISIDSLLLEEHQNIE